MYILSKLWVGMNSDPFVFSMYYERGSDMIPNRVDGCQDSGIINFNILVKLCICPYIINHVMCIALF